jgi:hypothetical protein
LANAAGIPAASRRPLGTSMAPACLGAAGFTTRVAHLSDAADRTIGGVCPTHRLRRILRCQNLTRVSRRCRRRAFLRRHVMRRRIHEQRDSDERPHSDIISCRVQLCAVRCVRHPCATTRIRGRALARRAQRLPVSVARPRELRLQWDERGTRPRLTLCPTSRVHCTAIAPKQPCTCACCTGMRPLDRHRLWRAHARRLHPALSSGRDGRSATGRGQCHSGSDSALTPTALSARFSLTRCWTAFDCMCPH